MSQSKEQKLPQTGKGHAAVFFALAGLFSFMPESFPDLFPEIG
ncbi:MAG: LPXTG cell wall anchor domain-containing protein [Lentisphaeria bacterium]|nr:LPXTG cell wall anchor domain-containing protein [Lentisphaeria bacterium]